jgi:hypothetical protein
MPFTLVGPLGIHWWVPLACLAVALAVITGLTRFCRDRRDGFWKGLAVMRGLRGRNAIVGLVVFAVSAQVARSIPAVRRARSALIGGPSQAIAD